MKTKTIIWIAALSSLFILVIIFTANFISFSNKEVMLKNAFTQKFSERTTFYDKMWKTLSQKSQIAIKNDSSFKDNVNIIMAGRKDAQGTFMKWITESNPNANYHEVSVLYQDLSRAVEAQREGFFVEEKYMQDIVFQHSNLIQQFPGIFFNYFLGRTAINYTPITSDQTDEVIKSGKDNNTKLF